MEISPLALSILLISSFLWGGLIGVLNDANKMIRVFLCGESFYERHEKMIRFFKLKKIKKKALFLNKTYINVLIFIQDVFSIIIATVGLVLLNYYYNDGYFRLFTFFAFVLGFVIYYFTIGKLVTFILQPITFFLRCLIVTIVRILVFPISYLFKCIRNLTINLFLKYKKSIEKNENIRYNKKRKEMLIKLSEIGFLTKDVKKV